MNQTRKNKKCSYCEKEFPKRQAAFLKAILKKQPTKKKLNAVGRNKKSQEICKRSYCNPTCEGTLFEPGKGVPKSLIEKTRRNLPGNTQKAKKARNAILGLQRLSRKTIFGKKTDVLKNGFYEKLPKKVVDKLKKSGATSGCAAAVL